MSASTEIAHPVLGTLTRDDEDWEGEMPLPSLASCQLLFRVDLNGEVYEEDAEEPGPLAPIRGCDAETGPSLVQDAAFRYVRENQDQLAAAVLEALLPVAQNNIAEAREGLDRDELLTFDDAVRQHQLETLHGVRSSWRRVGSWHFRAGPTFTSEARTSKTLFNA